MIAFVTDHWIIILFSIAAVSFFIFKPIHDSRIRLATLVALDAVILSLPVGLPVNDPSTILASVLCSMVALKLVELSLFNVKAQSSYLQWIKELAFYFFPIYYVPESKRKSFSEIVGLFIHTVIVVILKLVSLQFVWNLMSTCLDEATVERTGRDYVARTYYSAWFSVAAVGGFWINDLQAAFLPLFTLGRYEMLFYNNYPILSSSVREFWSRRYNRIISKLLHDTVFTPLKDNLNQRLDVAALVSFGMSALLHFYVVVLAFGRGVIPTLIFFLLNGFATVLENYAYKRWNLHKYPIIFRILITQSFVLLTMPMYIGLYIDAAEGMINSQPPITPFFDTLQTHFKELPLKRMCF